MTDIQAESFPNISSEWLLSAVESTGLRCTGRYLQLNSMENRVYSVETDDELQKNVVVKFYRPGRWTPEMLASEHNMQRVLQEEDIPTPRLLELLHNRQECALATQGAKTLGKIESLYFCVWERVRGRTPLEMDASHLQEIGQTVARMHNLFENKLVSSKFLRHSMSPLKTGAEAFYTIQGLSFVPTHFKIAILDFIEELTAKISFLEENECYFPIHNDLHRNNLMQTQESGNFWVMDFDDCAYGPAIQDLWLLAAGADTGGESSPMEDLLAGYEKFRKMPVNQLGWIEALRALKLIHYIGWIGKRWKFDSLFRITFSFFAEPSYWETTLNDLADLNEKVLNPVSS